jgi:hypothetical protein
MIKQLVWLIKQQTLHNYFSEIQQTRFSKTKRPHSPNALIPSLNPPKTNLVENVAQDSHG